LLTHCANAEFFTKSNSNRNSYTNSETATTKATATATSLNLVARICLTVTTRTVGYGRPVRVSFHCSDKSCPGVFCPTLPVACIEYKVNFLAYPTVILHFCDC
jgi:hypothetical protein